MSNTVTSYVTVHGGGKLTVEDINLAVHGEHPLTSDYYSATIVTEDGETRNKQYPVHWPRERVWDAIRREMALLGGEFVQEEES